MNLAASLLSKAKIRGVSVVPSDVVVRGAGEAQPGRFP